MIEKLMALYEGCRVDKVDNLSAYYCVTIEGTKLYIPLEKLDDTQRELLSLLCVENEKEDEWDEKALYWHDVLTGKQLEVSFKEEILVIYIRSQQALSNQDGKMWAMILQDALTFVEAVLPISSQELHIVVRAPKMLDTLKESLKEVIGALEADFNTSVVACVGQRHKVDSHLAEHYQSETQIMMKCLPKCQGVVEWSHLLLKAIGRLAIDNVLTLARLRKTIAQSDDYQRTIRALFEHQGNVTQAAESLFVHRNTLMYRTQKFAKETQMNLHYLPELTLCYLMLE